MPFATAASKWLLQFLVRRRADSELDGGQNTVIMIFDVSELKQLKTLYFYPSFSMPPLASKGLRGVRLGRRCIRMS